MAEFLYGTGGHGLPESVFFTTRDGHVEGGSGEMYSLTRTPFSLEIRQKNQPFYCIAELYVGTLQFNIRTRANINGIDVYSPDLFAAAFMELSIDYFTRQRKPIHSILHQYTRSHGEIHPDGTTYWFYNDNFEQFERALSPTLNPSSVEVYNAATQTWACRVTEALGFPLFSAGETGVPERFEHARVTLIHKPPYTPYRKTS